MYLCGLFRMIKNKQILPIFFVALFMSYYASTVFFPHLHTINGTTIVHSHFHHNSHHDTKSGNHTEESIVLIAQFSNFDLTDFLYNYVLIPLQNPLYEKKLLEPTHCVASVYLENLSLRAPPIV